jgi:alpha-L-rhamnosidase
MNSYNHYAYGAVGDWIYRYAAGIDATPSDPGFHTIRLHPNFDSRLGHMEFSYDSSFGKISSSWTSSGKTAMWNLTIPPNSTGVLKLGAAERTSYRLEGKALSENSKIVSGKEEDGKQTFEIPAGTYQFDVALP